MATQNSAAARRTERLGLAKQRAERTKTATTKRNARIEERLARAEAQAKAEIQGNPDFEQVFTNYQSYMTYMQNLPEEERKTLLGDLTEEANALVDKPYDEKTQRLKDDLDLRLRTLNQKYGSLDDTSAQNLSQAIQKADRDTVDALTASFESIMSRGLMNGGILTQLADRILQNKEDYVKDLRADDTLAKSQRDAAKALENEGITQYGNEAQGEIDDSRRIARSVQESELFGEQATLRFLQQQGMASRLLPQELATTLDRINNATAPVTPTPVGQPTATTPGSRLPSGYKPTTSTPATPEEGVQVPGNETKLSLTQRRILSGPRPSIRGIRSSAAPTSPY